MQLIYKLRLIPTFLITVKGATSIIKGDVLPSKNIKLLQVGFTSYIISDLIVLLLSGNCTIELFIHHALFITTAALSYKKISGNDSVPISNIYPYACTAEGMALLSCLNHVSHRRYNNYFQYLHLFNILFIRLPIWLYCIRVRCDKIENKSYKQIIRTIGYSIICFGLLLDIYDHKIVTMYENYL